MSAIEEKVAEVHAKYGRTIHEILAKEMQYDRYEILGAIEMLVYSKIIKNLTTSKSERMVFGFAWLVREVQNGGFDQYFFNSAGDYWNDVLYGLEAISDKEGLAAFKKVLSIFPNSTPSEVRSERMDQLSKLNGAEEAVSEEDFLEAVKKARRIPADSAGDQLGLNDCVHIELDSDDETRVENKGVSEHWDSVSREFYSKPYPDSKLVYQFVKNHAEDFDLEKA